VTATLWCLQAAPREGAAAAEARAPAYKLPPRKLMLPEDFITYRTRCMLCKLLRGRGYVVPDIDRCAVGSLRCAAIVTC
jgi:hypothetical protein